MRARHLFFAIASAAVLSVGALSLVGWMISDAFTNAAPGLAKLSDVVGAALGRTLARAKFRVHQVEATRSSAVEFYDKHPEVLQRDLEFFKTWQSALAIADSGVSAVSGRWESSSALSWIAPALKVDGWGHTFCVKSNHRRTVIVSPGPGGPAALDCSSLSIPETNLAAMRSATLNRWRSGALVLFVDRTTTAPTAGEVVR